jgi:hypothetical protein
MRIGSLRSENGLLAILLRVESLLLTYKIEKLLVRWTKRLRRGLVYNVARCSWKEYFLLYPKGIA